MTSVSGDQQRMMGSALRRRMAGMPRSTDPKMSTAKLADFARKVPGAPERKNAPSTYGGNPVTEDT